MTENVRTFATYNHDKTTTTMIQFKTTLLLLTVPMLLMACGKDDPTEPTPAPKPAEPTETPVTPETPVATNNNNKNDATAEPLLALLEFPKAKGGTSEVIIHKAGKYQMNYALEWDHTLRSQRWTCYELYKGIYGKNGNTRKSLWNGSDPWNYDPDVPAKEQPATFNELSKSYFPGTKDIYSKGHVCPSADRIFTKDLNEQTFYMTNILPMVNNFNGGIWNTLEEKIRTWCGNYNSTTWSGTNFDTLYVCKGGTIDKEDQILDHTIASANVSGEGAHPGNHIVPRYFFTALLAKKGTTYKAIGFWFEHVAENNESVPLGNFVKSISELEQLTGIDFFCNLPDDVEKQMEATTAEEARQQWGL